MDEQICREFAERSIMDSCVPDWFKQTAIWFQEGFVTCGEFQAGLIDLANRGVICGELQQDIQLVALGISTTERATEIQNLYNWLLQEKERLEAKSLAAASSE